MDHCSHAPVFSLLEKYTMDATGDTVTVVLSPEGEAFFRAWLRRNKMWSDAGLHTVHAWSKLTSNSTHRLHKKKMPCAGG